VLPEIPVNNEQCQLLFAHSTRVSISKKCNL